MNPLIYPVLTLIVMVLTELYVLIGVGELIGPLTTVFLVVFTAVLGMLLVRYQGVSTVLRAQQAMARGEPPAVEMLEGVALFIGGILLLIPGFLTDIAGLLMLVPPLRRVLIRSLLGRFRPPPPPGPGGGPRTLEGEFWRDE